MLRSEIESGGRRRPKLRRSGLKMRHISRRSRSKRLRLQLLLRRHRLPLQRMQRLKKRLPLLNKGLMQLLHLLVKEKSE
jgi:hypothetical protein